jgi:hypothetical protein
MRVNNIYKKYTGYKQPISFNIYSFVGIVKTYYDLPVIVVKRVEFILKQIGTNYHIYFGPTPYENVVLGTVLFAFNEFKDRLVYETPPFDIREFTLLLYGESRIQLNITQIYDVKQVIENVFT